MTAEPTAVRAQDRADPLVAYLERQWAWSKETFGPALRTKGIVQHIKKELREIEAEPHDLAEWVDVIILAMDGFWRHGGKPADLLPAMQAKQDRNFARQWPDWRTMSEDSAIEHDRSGEATLPPPDADTRDLAGWLDSALSYLKDAERESNWTVDSWTVEPEDQFITRARAAMNGLSYAKGQGTGEREWPFAWMVRAENGNTIIWTRDRDQVRSLAERYGRPLEPLFLGAPSDPSARNCDWPGCGCDIGFTCQPDPSAREALASLCWTYMPSYGGMGWQQLREAVAEATIGDRRHVRETPEGRYIGHDMTDINFNSLNRIVSAFVRAALSPAPVPAASEATVLPEQPGRAALASGERER